MKTATIVIAGIALGLSFQQTVHAAADSVIVELGVYHCDDDAICEAGENYEFCPLDCTAPPATTTDEETAPTAPPSGIRPIQQVVVDLFKTLVPFIGGDEEGSLVPSDGSGYVCTDASCTAYTDDMTRSIVVSFEESYGMNANTKVSIKPISGEEVLFAWEEGVMMRIMRSPREFPIDPLSGELVYEGSSGGFTSFGAADSDIMYYSLFPKRADGSYGNPEFVIIKNRGTYDDEDGFSPFVTGALGTFFVAILAFVGRFVFLLI